MPIRNRKKGEEEEERKKMMKRIIKRIERIKKRHLIRAVWLMLFEGLILTACSEQHIEATQYKALPVDGWDASRVIDFQTDSISSTGQYILDIGLRTSASFPYPFKALTMSVKVTKGENKEMILNTPLNCILTDQGGDINGKGVSIYDYTFPTDTLSLQKGDKITITLQHIMQRRMLAGITDIGFTLKKIKEKQEYK